MAMAGEGAPIIALQLTSDSAAGGVRSSRHGPVDLRDAFMLLDKLLSMGMIWEYHWQCRFNMCPLQTVGQVLKIVENTHKPITNTTLHQYPTGRFRF